MKKKTTSRIRNWGEYHKARQQRGSLTIWVSADAVAKGTTPEKTGGRGAAPQFTDLAILTLATVQAVYQLGGAANAGLFAVVIYLAASVMSRAGACDLGAAAGWVRRAVAAAEKPCGAAFSA